MIDLPIGKALIVVHSDRQCKQECRDENLRCPNQEDCCKGCEIDPETIGGWPDNDICGCLCCMPEERRDEKHVIYKLVDHQEKNYTSLI